MINDRFVCGGVSVNLTIEDDGKFYVDVMAEGVGTKLSSKVEQDVEDTFINIRGKVEARLR